MSSGRQVSISAPALLLLVSAGERVCEITKGTSKYAEFRGELIKSIGEANAALGIKTLNVAQAQTQAPVAHVG